jgi:hypothetical protein
MARDSFKTFIPLSVEAESRSAIIFDFFNLLSAIAAHGKTNGFSGRKLSRMASWWAFEQKDSEQGFEPGYKAWLRSGLHAPTLAREHTHSNLPVARRMPRAICSSPTYVLWGLRQA